jgi:hypothetical protein
MLAKRGHATSLSAWLEKPTAGRSNPFAFDSQALNPPAFQRGSERPTVEILTVSNVERPQGRTGPYSSSRNQMGVTILERRSREQGIRADGPVLTERVGRCRRKNALHHRSHESISREISGCRQTAVIATLPFRLQRWNALAEVSGQQFAGMAAKRASLPELVPVRWWRGFLREAHISFPTANTANPRLGRFPAS